MAILGKDKGSQKKLDSAMLAINSMLNEIYSNKSSDEYKMKGDITKSPSYSKIEEKVVDLKTLKGYSQVDAADIAKMFNTLHRPIFKTMVKEYIMEHNDRNTVFTALFTVGYRLLVGELTRVFASTVATDKGVVYKPDKVSRKSDATAMIKLYNDQLEAKIDKYIKDAKTYPQEAPVNESMLIMAVDAMYQEEYIQEMTKREKEVIKGTVLGTILLPVSVGLMFSAGGIPFTLLHLIMTAGLGAVAGGRGQKQKHKNIDKRDVEIVDDIKNIIEFLRQRASSDAESDMKEFKKRVKNLRSNCSDSKLVVEKEKRQFYADMNEACNAVLKDLRKDASNEEVMSNFLEKMVALYEVITGEKLGDYSGRTVQESAIEGEFIQEFTLIELILTCAAIGVGSSLISGAIRRHKDKKAVKNQEHEKEMYERLKNVTKLIESTKDFAVMKPDWSYDEPDDDGMSDTFHDWFEDQNDFKYHCDRIVDELGKLGEVLTFCKEKKTALYLILPQETKDYTEFIWEMIDPFTLMSIDYDKQKFYTAEDIEPVKKACEEFETKTREFMEKVKGAFQDIVKEAAENLAGDDDDAEPITEEDNDVTTDVDVDASGDDDTVQEGMLGTIASGMSEGTKTLTSIAGSLTIIATSVAIIAGLFKGINSFFKGINPVADVNALFMNSYESKIDKLASVSKLYDETKKAYEEYMKIPAAQRNKKVESKYVKNMEKYNISMQNLAAQIEHYNQRAKKESADVVNNIETRLPNGDVKPAEKKVPAPNAESKPDAPQQDDDFQF